ncbi:MAG: restriction endonuclease subunit S [Segatella copri]
MEWKEVRLGDVCDLIAGFAFKAKDFGEFPTKVIKIGDIKPPFVDYVGQVGVDISNYDINRLSKYTVKYGDYVLAMTGATIGKVGKYISKNFSYINQRVLKFSPKQNVDVDYINYIICSNIFAKYVVNYVDSESAQPNISASTISKFAFQIPSEKDDQRRIASILSSLDRKIELNNKINADLEEMAQAIFKNWFVDFEPFKDGKFVDSELGKIPEGWKVGRLTEIASYMNGLAMQKFPPENNEDSLPVLKIKELGQGFCGTDSDRCSCNIKDECKIHNGDVIFSWSGTLLVDVWCGGDCGLNQHLFKVTSKYYPKWFYYYWTKHHLQEFIHIAKDKAVTMGHIKRGHLEEALVAIPDNDSMERAHELFEPILSKMISLRLENSRLSLLRDTLLPRLMSGELEVPE